MRICQLTEDSGSYCSKKKYIVVLKNLYCKKNTFILNILKMLIFFAFSRVLEKKVIRSGVNRWEK